jgi:hypothetical protein
LGGDNVGAFRCASVRFRSGQHLDLDSCSAAPRLHSGGIFDVCILLFIGRFVLQKTVPHLPLSKPSQANGVQTITVVTAPYFMYGAIRYRSKIMPSNCFGDNIAWENLDAVNLLGLMEKAKMNTTSRNIHCNS